MVLTGKHLSKSFREPKKVTLFTDLSLELEQGISLAICGRSGEGKSTLLHILGGLEIPDTGSVTLLGETLTLENSATLRLHHIGFVFQSFHLFEDLSVLDNVLMPARLARKRVDRSYGVSLLEKVGLQERALFPAKLLSGGERQRVAIARALCNNPSLLMADEPSGNLDHANAEAIRDLLFSLVEQEKHSLLLVTHEEALASRCTRRLFLHDGQLK